MSCEGRRHFLRGVFPNLAANDSTEPHGLMQRKKKKATHPAQAKKPKAKKKKKKKKAKKKSAPVVRDA